MPHFVDSNVIAYSRDRNEAHKQPLARAWMDYLWETDDGRLSIQVLNEYYVTVTRKFDPAMPRRAARADVEDLLAWRPVSVDTEVLTDALEIEGRHRISLWDALIVAAAKTAGCEKLLTEDLRDGQTIDGVLVVNPFDHPPPTS